MGRTKINTIALKGSIKIMLQIGLYGGFKSCYFPLIKHNGYLCGIQHIQIVKVAIWSGKHWFNEETQTRNRNTRNLSKCTTQHAPSSNCKEPKSKHERNETLFININVIIQRIESNLFIKFPFALAYLYIFVIFFSFWIFNKKSNKSEWNADRIQSTKWRKKTRNIINFLDFMNCVSEYSEWIVSAIQSS